MSSVYRLVRFSLTPQKDKFYLITINIGSKMKFYLKKRFHKCAGSNTLFSTEQTWQTINSLENVGTRLQGYSVTGLQGYRVTGL